MGLTALQNVGQRVNLFLGEGRRQIDQEMDFKGASDIVDVEAESRHDFRFRRGRDGPRLAVEFVAASVQMREFKRESAQRFLQGHAVLHPQIDVAFATKHGMFRDLNFQIEGSAAPSSTTHDVPPAWNAHLVPIGNAWRKVEHEGF